MSQEPTNGITEEQLEKHRVTRDRRVAQLVNLGFTYNRITACFKHPTGLRISKTWLIYTSDETWSELMGKP